MVEFNAADDLARSERVLVNVHCEGKVRHLGRLS